MLVIEAQANSKQCPQAMLMSGAVGCLGAGCMAWRWEDPAGNIRIEGLPADAYLSKDLPGLEPRGFCGLAGDPRKHP